MITWTLMTKVDYLINIFNEIKYIPKIYDPNQGCNHISNIYQIFRFFLVGWLGGVTNVMDIFIYK